VIPMGQSPSHPETNVASTMKIAVEKSMGRDKKVNIFRYASESV